MSAGLRRRCGGNSGRQHHSSFSYPLFFSIPKLCLKYSNLPRSYCRLHLHHGFADLPAFGSVFRRGSLTPASGAPITCFLSRVYRRRLESSIIVTYRTYSTGTVREDGDPTKVQVLTYEIGKVINIPHDSTPAA
jgi:hypothetical protein